MECNRVIHAGLNTYQHEAVHLRDGRFVLAASAGAGKTSVVVLRVEQLIQDGIDPARIGAFTFAKDAATEMVERGRSLGFPQLRIGTLHSLCYEIIRMHGLDWVRANVEVDDRGRIRMIMKIILDREYQDYGLDIGVAGQLIGLAKAACLSMHPALNRKDRAEVIRFFQEVAPQPWLAERYTNLYEAVEKERETRNLIDFDDMLILAYLTLSNSASAADFWSRRFDYVLIDEAQDNSLVQNRVAEVLMRNARSLMLVGDIQQAIFQFRGARPADFVAYANSFELKRLPINYRSTSEICMHATALTYGCLWNVTGATEPRPDAPSDPHSAIAVEYDTPEDEATGIAREIQALLIDGTEPRSIAVLYRVTALLPAIEEALIAARIPYVVWSGAVFYERREIKDLLAYLRVIAMRDSDESQVKRALIVPTRYIGKAYVQAVDDLAHAENIAFLDALNRYVGPKPAPTRRARDFHALMLGLNERSSKGEKPVKILNLLLNSTGYFQHLKREDGTEFADPDSGRAANVHRLLRMAEGFSNLNEFLDYVDQASMTIRAARGTRDANAVRLATIHKFKGLEADHVFSPGWVEGVLPHALNPDQDEELRLAFVCLTRARKRFRCSWSKTILSPTGARKATPSKFIGRARIPIQHVVSFTHSTGAEHANLLHSERP